MLGDNLGVDDRDGVLEPGLSDDGLDIVRDTRPALIASDDERGEDGLDVGFLSSFSWTCGGSSKYHGEMMREKRLAYMIT